MKFSVRGGCRYLNGYDGYISTTCFGLLFPVIRYVFSVFKTRSGARVFLPNEILPLPSIHPWHYSPFRALASLKSCLHSPIFSALLLHPRVPNICNASFCTASSHLILGLPTGLVLWNFPFSTFFGILPSSILIIWPAHPNLLILISSTIFRSLYNLYSSLFHLGHQCPSSCVAPYIRCNIFLANVCNICCVVCVSVQVTLP